MWQPLGHGQRAVLGQAMGFDVAWDRVWQQVCSVAWDVGTRGQCAGGVARTFESVRRMLRLRSCSILYQQRATAEVSPYLEK